jgi:DNA-binding response OmpR family regulator
LLGYEGKAALARIAVVDDDPHLRKLLQTMLGRRGHEPVAFPDGAEALLAIQEGGFDLVLSDVQMPRLDGVSLCKALREIYPKWQLPILLISVLDKEEDILRAMEAGASDYMVKPYSLSLLQAKLTLHLNRPEAPEPGYQRPQVLLAEPPSYPYPFDNYDLLEVLGQGGYAIVFRARSRADGRVVAVKILEREITHDREGLARYFREVALLTQINSPHVVQILDSGYEQGRYYLAMELVPGEPADIVLMNEGPFDVRRTLELGLAVTRAVGALQDQGLVHRDIKPGNVMIGEAGRITLVDLGLAKGRQDPALTSPDDIMGTPDYIAPEVLHGDAEHVGSDLYAIGITMHELLAGEPPFPGNTPYEILVNVASGMSAPPIDTVRPDVPKAVSDFVGMLTEPDPKRRITEPAQAEQLFQDLLSAL